MSNLKHLVALTIVKYKSLRLAENKTGVNYSKLHRMSTGTDAMEDDIETLEAIRKSLDISPSTFWSKLTGNK